MNGQRRSGIWTDWNISHTKKKILKKKKTMSRKTNETVSRPVRCKRQRRADLAGALGTAELEQRHCMVHLLLSKAHSGCCIENRMSWTDMEAT